MARHRVVRGRLSDAQTAAVMAEVERWQHAWRRHLEPHDELAELVQCARIEAWVIACSLVSRGLWRPGSATYAAWWGYRKGWESYKREHNLDRLGGLCRHGLAVAEGKDGVP